MKNSLYLLFAGKNLDYTDTGGWTNCIDKYSNKIEARDYLISSILEDFNTWGHVVEFNFDTKSCKKIFEVSKNESGSFVLDDYIKGKSYLL